tara:strand:- start:450 stop:932 length:483 start_codon:yes stop_codon:yes gene_type:complete
MSLYKDNIPEHIKLKVWNRDSNNNIICACGICNKLVRPPLKIFKKINNNYKFYTILSQQYAQCHYGHIISEYNGGQVTVDNLKIICAKCNLQQGSKNMNLFKPQYEYMCIDINDNCIDNSNISLLMDTDECLYQRSNGLKCKNAAMIDCCYCHIHIHINN